MIAGVAAISGWAEAASLVGAQIARYQELLVLLEMERDAVRQENMPLLSAVLAQKQALIDAIVTVEDRLNPFRCRAAGTMETAAGEGEPAASGPEAEAARAYWQQSRDLGSLMREAVSCQNANEALLGERMEAMRRRIRSLGDGQRTLSGYGASVKAARLPHVPRFIDRHR